MPNAQKLLTLLFILSVVGFVITASDENDTTSSISESNFIIPSIGATDDYWFAGERVPLGSFDVRERLEREFIVLTYRHSTTILNLKNSRRYFAIIAPILKEYGIPDDFKYAAIAESDLINNATSPAGARGIWQLMKSTAQDNALEVNDYVDERLHVEKSTRVACQHLRGYFEKFGSWNLAAAAYNLGGSKLQKSLDNQRADNYYNLNLGEETNRYLLRLVAFKYLLLDPEKYGFELRVQDLYAPLSGYSLISVDSTINNLGDFGRKYGVSYRVLKLYNPWLLDSRLPNKSGKVYQIKIPRS